jgi:hypothetical protein
MQPSKGAKNNDSLFKISPIIDLTKDTYVDVFGCGKEASIDERMLHFEGRLYFKQYMHAGPSPKWGIQIWSLCYSNTGYTLRLNVYTGKETNQDPVGEDGLAARVVTTLMKDLENRGHVIYIWTIFIPALVFLKILGRMVFEAFGTVRANRKGLPTPTKGAKMKRDELPRIRISRDKEMLACT